jgi:hypothetical protein
MRGKANCCCLARVQLSVLHPGDGRAVRRWLPSPSLWMGADFDNAGPVAGKRRQL